MVIIYNLAFPLLQVPMESARPFSRVGSAMGDRPGSSILGRPMSGRVGTARGIPGTASRLVATAMQNRPMSRGGIVPQTAVKVDDRPITQQGLSGMRSGTARGPGRRFEDKSFYMGELRRKMSELQGEINKISREVESAKEEQSTFLAYDKRVKELAIELTGKWSESDVYTLLLV